MTYWCFGDRGPEVCVILRVGVMTCNNMSVVPAASMRNGACCYSDMAVLETVDKCFIGYSPAVCGVLVLARVCQEVSGLKCYNYVLV